MNETSRRGTVLTLAVLMTTLTPAVQAKTGRHKRRVIVTFEEGTSRAERVEAARAMGLSVRDDLDGLQVAVLEAEGDVTPQEFARSSARSPKIASVEEDVYRNWLLDAPSFPASAEAVVRQFAHPPAAAAAPKAAERADVPWGVARVDAPAAWTRGQGEGVKVAVIDTGIDCSHPDLQCDFRKGTNVLDPSSPPMDDHEHGTHVAGTIAGRGLDGGVLGVAPKATLIPVKVLDADGAGSLSDIVKGIEWATVHGADVINMSLGGADGSPALERAVKKALAAKVVVVCAAGNSGPGPDTVGYPAGYPGVISVAASDRTDAVADFSSRGRVSFIAPGVEITSTVPGGGYKKLSGTSMASPHVAGLAALAVERGEKGPAGARAALAAASSRLSGLSQQEEGSGMIDAAKIR